MITAEIATEHLTEVDDDDKEPAERRYQYGFQVGCDLCSGLDVHLTNPLDGTMPSLVCRPCGLQTQIEYPINGWKVGERATAKGYPDRIYEDLNRADLPNVLEFTDRFAHQREDFCISCPNCQNRYNEFRIDVELVTDELPYSAGLHVYWLCHSCGLTEIVMPDDPHDGLPVLERYNGSTLQ